MTRYLFHTGADKQVQHYVSKDDIYEVLKASHDGPFGGNFEYKRIGHKLL